MSKIFHPATLALLVSCAGALCSTGAPPAMAQSTATAPDNSSDSSLNPKSQIAPTATSSDTGNLGLSGQGPSHTYIQTHATASTPPNVSQLKVPPVKGRATPGVNTNPEAGTGTGT